MEEVFEAVFELNGEKVLGSDGFPITFWQFNWDFVKEDLMGFFNEF